MTERIRVTAAELKEHWFSDQAAGLIHDHQTGTKVVRMADGTEYETPFDELKVVRMADGTEYETPFDELEPPC